MRGLHTEWFVPRAKIHLLPSLPHLQPYLHPTTRPTFLYLLDGPNHPAVWLQQAGGRRHGHPGETRLAKLCPLVCCFASRDWDLGGWEGGEALPAGRKSFSSDTPILPTRYGE